MSKQQLFAAMLSLLVCVPSYANAALNGTATAAQEQSESRNGVNDETVNQELELFRSVEVSLREALRIAGKLHAGSRIVDISFDGGSGSPVYRVKTFRREQIWEDTIDAKTGRIIGNTTVSSTDERGRQAELRDRGSIRFRPQAGDSRAARRRGPGITSTPLTITVNRTDLPRLAGQSLQQTIFSSRRIAWGEPIYKAANNFQQHVRASRVFKDSAPESSKFCARLSDGETLLSSTLNTL